MERAVVELVYKFDKKSTASVKSTEVLFKLLGGSHTYSVYTYTQWTPTLIK